MDKHYMTEGQNKSMHIDRLTLCYGYYIDPLPYQHKKLSRQHYFYIKTPILNTV